MIPNSYITFSFDDGCIHDFKTAKLLRDKGFRATFYISTHHKRNPLSKEQISDLSHCVEIGGHTSTHVTLDSLPYKQQYEEIYANKIYLEEIICKEVDCFCYPKGRYNQESIEVVKNVGYKYARTVKSLETKINNIFETPTTFQLYPHSRFNYFKNSLKNFNFLNFVKVFSRIKFNNDKQILFDLTKYYADNVKKNGGIMHLWGHSWEINKFNYWDDFEAILDLLVSYNFTPTTNSKCKDDCIL